MLIPMAISIAMTRSIAALLLVSKKCVVLQRKHQKTSGQLQKESIFLQGVLLDPHLAIEVDTVILTSEKISQFHVNLDKGFLLGFTADFCLSYFQVDRTNYEWKINHE
jgi:hypothetical protein